MNIAMLSGLIIFTVLLVMLLAGAPIAVSLGVSSILAILTDLKYPGNGCHRSPENFLWYLRVQLTGNSILYFSRKYHEPGRYCHSSDQSGKTGDRTNSWRPGSYQCSSKYVIRRDFRFRYCGSFCHGFHHRTDRGRRGL